MFAHPAQLTQVALPSQQVSPVNAAAATPSSPSPPASPSRLPTYNENRPVDRINVRGLPEGYTREQGNHALLSLQLAREELNVKN
eukprot:14116181-Alexandrium_andersonii.AAC.1